MKRKITALLLSLIMLLSVLPSGIAVYAEGGEIYSDCLTFSSTEPFKLSTTNGSKSWNGKLEYSTDHENWTEWTGVEITSDDDLDNGVYNIFVRNISGNANYYVTGGSAACNPWGTGVNSWSLSNAKDVQCKGNIMNLLNYEAVSSNSDITMYSYCFYEMFIDCSLLTTAPDLPATTLADYCYKRMFCGCKSLTSVPELPATTMAEGCYCGMFQQCTALKTAPELPAETLANECYEDMFCYCSSLTTAPSVLPAETLTNNCYSGMFDGCSSLAEAPEISAETVAYQSCMAMFNNCSSLTVAPALKAETMAEMCYQQMFKGCTALTEAPELPAETLASNCYANMFTGCSSLTEAPELPAVALSTRCYFNMFKDCTSLKEAPELPAETMEVSAYQNMFKGCTSLTEAPELPATVLADKCYSGMFQGCTFLTEAPELPATTLAEKCYYNMFNGCTSLTDLPDLPATELATDCYTDMFKDCPKSKDYVVTFSKVDDGVSEYSKGDTFSFKVAITSGTATNAATTWNNTVLVLSYDNEVLSFVEPSNDFVFKTGDNAVSFSTNDGKLMAILDTGVEKNLTTENEITLTFEYKALSEDASTAVSLIAADVGNSAQATIGDMYSVDVSNNSPISVSLKTTSVVAYKYFSGQSKTMWKINVEIPTALEAGKTLASGTNPLFITQDTTVYTYLVVYDTDDVADDAKALTVAADFEVSVIDGVALTYNSTTNHDVNMTNKLDFNDSQLAYDIACGMYQDFEKVSMQKFLNADRNGDNKVEIGDAGIVSNAAYKARLGL